MRNFRIDDYKVKAEYLDGKPDYGLSVHVIRNKKIIAGGILRTDSKEADVLEFALARIKENK